MAAPFAFGTYKARPTQLVWVPLTAHDKEHRANYLDTDDCKSFDNDDGVLSYEEFFCYSGDRLIQHQHFKIGMLEELQKGGRDELHADLPKYWMMNVGIAATTASTIFGLTFLIPMLVRGFAFLIRGYWKWLNT